MSYYGQDEFLSLKMMRLVDYFNPCRVSFSLGSILVSDLSLKKVLVLFVTQFIVYSLMQPAV